MAKKAKKSGKGKARKAVKTVSTARKNQFTEPYLYSVADGLDMEKFLTARQRGAYEENQAPIDTAVKGRLEKFLLAFECPIDQVSGLSADDMDLFHVGFLKIVRQIVNPYVKPAPMVWDLDKLGISETDFLAIVEKLEAQHGISVAEAIDFLNTEAHKNQRSKNIVRSLQGFLQGSYTAYNRKNLHTSKTWTPVLSLAC